MHTESTPKASFSAKRKEEEARESFHPEIVVKIQTREKAKHKQNEII